MNKIFNIPKMKLIIISASVVLVLSVVIVIVACLNTGKNGQPEDGDAIGAIANADGSVNEPAADPETPSSPTAPTDASGLTYLSHGDGTCEITSMGTCTLKELVIPAKSPAGDTVVSIASGSFNACRSLESISIPADVKTIGNGAFTGCTSLCVITVESSNTAYCAVGNVLFNKDKTELVCYPAARVGKSYLLSTNVKTVSAYAFDSVSNLTKILYTGSASKYQDISVGNGNNIFTGMSVTCNYVGAK